ncbi:MAG TPA: hypothetical protein VF656_05985 [Pyrinomonadaceae bacterium]|jgi:DNA uptake protein ComE-like DNA-binding protein
MLRPSIVRVAVLSSALVGALLVAGCGAGVEKANTNNANANAASSNNANANHANGNAPTASTAADITPGQTGAAKPKLNLNTATGDEFRAQIPNLGNRMVHEFEEYRPYKSIQQFRREMAKYVKPEQIAEYEQYVFVPISENEADAATLQQIPGLDAAEAEALVKGRPYASREAFLAKLSEKISLEELTVAKTYLGGK